MEDFDLEGARIGVLRDAFGDSDNSHVEPVNTIINDALIDLRTAGATLVDPINIADLNNFLDDTSLYGLVAKRDLNDFIETLSEPPVETFEEIYEQGLYHNALEHIETIASAPVDPTVDSEYWFRLARQKALQQAIMYCLAEKNLDALAFPNVQVVPPMFEGYHTGDLTRADVPTNTLIASQSGCPAVSMPAGFTENGLPIGLELLGAPLSDRKLVSALPLHMRRSPIHEKRLS